MSRVVKKIASIDGCLKILALAAIVTIIGGCSTPVLEKRANVPAPTISPDLTSTTSEAQPIGTTAATTMNQGSSLPEFPQVKAEEQKYTVKRGDSLWKIATMYGVGTNELASYNNIDTKKVLKVGTVLNIPPGGKFSAKQATHHTAHHKKAVTKTKHHVASKHAATTTTAAASNAEGTYVVKSGDSLWLIAKHLKTTSTKLADANGISKGAPLQVGQKLVIPKNEKTVAQTDNNNKEDNQMMNELMNQKSDTAAPVSTSTKNDTSAVSAQASANQDYLPHTVKDGDTWDSISEMYGVGVDSLKKANPKITSDSQLKAGIVINIPEE